MLKAGFQPNFTLFFCECLNKKVTNIKIMTKKKFVSWNRGEIKKK